MNDRKIYPFQGIDSLRFDTPRSVVRNFLNTNFRSFRKGAFASNETDAYDNLGLHLYYDNDDALEFIETFPPCNPMFDGIELLKSTLEHIIAELAAKGFKVTTIDEGYNYTQLGIVLYTPNNLIEAVSIYRKGYYDE